MKVAITLEVQPLEVPNYVRVMAPVVPGRDAEPLPVPIEQVDAKTLDALCDAFRAALFKQAKKSPPPTVCYMAPNLGVTDEMVMRFLSWKLPQTFAPDCGISFDGRKDDEWNKNKTWPVGTNLLTAGQARAMLEHVLGVTDGSSKDSANG